MRARSILAAWRHLYHGYLAYFPATIVGITLIFIAASYVFWPVIIGHSTWSSMAQDRNFMMIPIFSALTKQEMSWRILQHMFGGVPMYNNGNYTPYYPFYFLFDHLYDGLLAAARWQDTISLLHFFIAGLCTFAGMKILRVHTVAATMAGIVVMLSKDMQALTGWTEFAAAYAWLPLFLPTVIAIGAGDRRSLLIVTAIAAASLIIHASTAHGAVEVAFGGISAALVGLFSAKGNERWPGLARLAIVGFGILAINAAALEPIAFFDQPMIRWFGNGTSHVGEGSVPSDLFFAGSVAPADLVSMLVPTNYQSIIGNVYIGLPIVALAIFAFRYGSNRKIKIGLGIACILWVIVLCGDKTPASYVLEHIPFFNKIRNPPRHMPMVIVSFVMLAALALDDLFRRRDIWIGRRFLLPPIAVLFAWGWFAALPTATQTPLPSTIAILGTLVVVAAYFEWRKAAPVVVAGTISLGSLSRPQLMPMEQFQKDTQPYLVSEQVASLAKDGRLLFLGSRFSKDNRYVATALGAGADVFAGKFGVPPADQFFKYYGFSNSAGPLDRLRGAEYLLSDGVEPPAPWKEERQIGSFTFYIDQTAYPMVYGSYRIAGQLRRGSKLKAVAPLVAANADPIVAVSEQDSVKLASLLSAGSPGKPAIGDLLWSGNDVTFLAETTAPAIIALNMYDGPAWRATVNGNSAHVFRINGLHPGVVAPAGKSRITFHYGPYFLDWLYRLRLASLLALLGYSVWIYYRFIKRNR